MTGPGTSFPRPVGYVLIDDGFLDETEVLAESVSTVDDAFWLRRARGPWQGWQAFTNWWIARRWVQPRDIRKR